MQDRKELIKAITEAVSPLIDAKYDLLKTILMAEIKDIRKNMATKDDIKNMATKEDIKDMATKDDIHRLEKNMQRIEKKLDKEINNHEARIEALEKVYTNN